MLPLWARVELGAIPQSSSTAGTSPSDCLVSYPGHLLGGVLPLCRGAVSVFYSPSQLGNVYLWSIFCQLEFVYACWNKHDFIYLLHIYISSSSSCCATSMDIPDPLSLPLPIVNCFWPVFAVTSRFATKLLYVGSGWLSCFCLFMWRGPQEYITYELIPTSPALSCMSGSSNMDSFHDGW